MKKNSLKTLIGSAIAAVFIVAAVVWILPLAKHRSQNTALGREWLRLLRKHPVFSATPSGYAIEVDFQYAGPGDENFEKLRALYGLEAVAGGGSETDRIINLTRWVYKLTGHANEPEIPKELNALNLIPLARDRHMQINCFMKTVILNEVFLALGFASRQTHLLPHSREEEESHFITSVFSKSLQKWILMDPDFGVYVTDPKGGLLGVAEIRRRLIDGSPLKVVSFADAGRSGLAVAWDGFRNFLDGTSYLWFLSDFVFKIRCPRVSEFDQRSKPGSTYFELIPDGYRGGLPQEIHIDEKGRQVFYLNNERLFWQKPAGSSLKTPSPKQPD
jgi:hypothetical protein